jgi:hypothetical protein
MIILNKGQEKVVSDIIDFYNTPGELFYVLEAPAGTGKSTSIQIAIKRLKEQSASNLSVCLTAPTNKATKVLREMAYAEELEVHCRTIYSILGLVLNNNNEIRHASKMADGVFEDYQLIVVDEASMCGKALWEELYDAAASNNIKVILMGDSFQLPPVKESASVAFNKGFKRGTLTEVMRQVNANPILTLTQKLRDAQSDPRIEVAYETEINPETDQGIYLLNPAQWTASVKENFSSDEYHSDPNSFRCLAYTNRRVNSLNRMIRNMLVGVTESPFIKGERVLVKRPITDLLTGDKVHTDEECEVLNIVETTHPQYDNTSQPFKVWELKLASTTGSYVDAYLLHNDSKQDHSDMLDMLGKAAKADGRRWKDFWGFKDSFHDMQPPHALTCHRSQGSSYSNVFVDLRDIYVNKKKLERLQLEYVACSRASETLVLMK